MIVLFIYLTEQLKEMGRILILLFLIPITSAHALEKICSSYYFTDDTISFTSNEKIFICGSKSDGWNEIPKAQANTTIKNLLSIRGYYQPSIKQVGKKYVVSKGKKSKISLIEFKNKPNRFDDEIYLGSIGNDLTEENLDEIENWTLNRLETLGYPCHSVKVQASFITEKVLVEINSGPRYRVKNIKRDNSTLLDPNSFKRHDALEEGDWYNGDYLSLTSRRLTNSGLVSYAYFNHSCKDPTTLTQKVTLNKPNTLIMGVGASTEELPIFKISWNNSRLDNLGSKLDSVLYLSSIEQSIEIGTTFYASTNSPSFYIKPFARFEIITEQFYKTRSDTVGITTGSSIDLPDSIVTFSLSPSKTREVQDEGEAPGESRFFALETTINLIDHYYEYFVASPRKGNEMMLKSTYFIGDTAVDNTSSKGNLLVLSGTSLINAGNFSPPDIILGVRYHYKTIVTDDISRTPQKYRLYLGGENDIRGFSRKSINNDEQGYTTTAHLAFETRFTNILPFNLQPLLFLDLAKVGFVTSSLTKTLYYAPGVGLRWQSPFGSFRTTIAKGLIQDGIEQEEEQYVFYLSYGREF
jgi:translocation and assembly module TamA